jgi:hypothetical protein
VITILADHNIEGQAIALWGTLSAEGWLELVPLRLITFAQAGLPPESSDREAWRFAQRHGMLLLTSNRRMRDADALEQTIREENAAYSFPVLTIGSVKRMIEKPYRERCAVRLLEIALDLETYMGTGRIFIP